MNILLLRLGTILRGIFIFERPARFAGEVRLRVDQLEDETAVRPPARFGGLIFEGDLVADFTEKPQAGEGWINGGFLVFEPEIFDYLAGDGDSLESVAGRLGKSLGAVYVARCRVMARLREAARALEEVDQ